MQFDSQWIFLAMACSASLYGGWRCIGDFSRARLLADVPTSKVRSAAQGFTELYGILEEGPEAPLRGPLTGKPCLWWRYRIEEEQRNDKGRSNWRTLEKGVSEGWFGLRDATGVCLIDPAGADVRPLTRERWEGRERHPRGMAKAPGLLGQLLGGGRHYRYTEERLEAGQPLYALGDFHSSGGGRQGLDIDGAQAAVIREWKGDFAGLLGRFDSDGDGQLDEREWQRVRLAARLEAEDRHRASSAAPTRHRLARPAERQPFILSSYGEDELGGKLRWQAAGHAALCLGGALLGAWFYRGLGGF
ncbi:E3 Ubiquitin ligase [compost metagenome]|uniref:RING-type E3 ubiquitin transferase n=1 Tax=Pseudomonas jinjuensis TaxID=198616 RepID=A0A1H0Q1L4_9PSED|nr:GIDE domain-containing protein [Pseudomonas jinjuensis]SDP10558.1 E3 Ubiquitin ligase [Pseudomonas jinjuensis]